MPKIVGRSCSSLTILTAAPFRTSFIAHRARSCSMLPIPPPLRILLCHSTTWLSKKLYGKDSCGTQNRWSLLLVANDFDRYAFSPLLHPPQAACGLKATNSATPAYFIKFKMQNAKCKIIGALRADFKK